MNPYTNTAMASTDGAMSKTEASRSALGCHRRRGAMRGVATDCIWTGTVSCATGMFVQARSEAARDRTASPLAVTQTLLADAGVLARSLQGGLRLGDVAAGHEQRQGVLVLGRPALKRCGAMNHAGHERVAAPVLGRRLQVGVEQRLVAVGAGADGALLGIEGFLPRPRSSHLEPVHGVLAVGSLLGQGERVSQRVEDAGITRRGRPAVVGIVLGLEPAVLPVAHDFHGALGVDQILPGAIPGQRGVITVG